MPGLEHLDRAADPAGDRTGEYFPTTALLESQKGVRIVRGVERRRPGEPVSRLRHHERRLETKLHTGIPDAADVRQNENGQGRETERRDHQQQVVRALVVPVDRAGYPTAAKPYVRAEVPGAARFPGEIGVDEKTRAPRTAGRERRRQSSPQLLIAGFPPGRPQQ